MADANLQLVISAQDNATKTLKGIGKSLSGVGTTLKTVGKYAGVAFGAMATAAVGFGVVKGKRKMEV